MAESVNTTGLFDKFVGVLKQVGVHLGLEAILKDAASHHAKALTASYFESLNFNDEAAFGLISDKVYEKLRLAGGAEYAAECLAGFNAWLATKERWRANCYRLIVVTHTSENGQIAVLNGMFTARSNAERDTIIMNLVHDKPIMMKFGEYLAANYAKPWEWIKAKFGSAYNWAQAELWPVLAAIPGQMDDFLGTTGVDTIRPACVTAKKSLRDARKWVRRHNGI